MKRGLIIARMKKVITILSDCSVLKQILDPGAGEYFVSAIDLEDSASMHVSKLSGEVFIKNDQIYCVYNRQINGRTFFTQSVFDTDLNYKSVNYRGSYKEENWCLFCSINQSQEWLRVLFRI